jgi:hypothetical protein
LGVNFDCFVQKKNFRKKEGYAIKVFFLNIKRFVRKKKEGASSFFLVGDEGKPNFHKVQKS